MCVWGGRGGHGVGELRCVCVRGEGRAWSGRVEMCVWGGGEVHGVGELRCVCVCVCGEGECMVWEC